MYEYFVVLILSKCIRDTDTSLWIYHDTTWYFLYYDIHNNTCIIDTPQHCY